MPFAYYHRLSPAKRAIYRRSAAIRDLQLPDLEALESRVAELEARLVGCAKGRRGASARKVARAAAHLLADICAQLEVVPLDRLRVLAVRPSDATSELHGLYERDEDGRTTITVWMRTAAKEQVVAFRTFLRTLLHELCHHLDYEHYELEDSYHTEGFFARESSLMRQLAPAPEPQPVAQLELPW